MACAHDGARLHDRPERAQAVEEKPLDADFFHACVRPDLWCW